VNKAATSAAQLVKCILLHAYSCTTASFQLRENKQKLHTAKSPNAGILKLQLAYMYIFGEDLMIDVFALYKRTIFFKGFPNLVFHSL